MNTAEYLSIIENIKSEITATQYRAAVYVNTDMLLDAGIKIVQVENGNFLKGDII